MAKFRVRFAPQPLKAPLESQLTSSTSSTSPRRHTKSRYGCRECKQSRLKCDETFPACQRCTRRGIPCHAAAREHRWQMQVPGLTLFPSSNGLDALLHAGGHLVRYWVEKASRILVTSEDENPFAYPIMEHLLSSQSLLHVVRSIASAHQHFFQESRLRQGLEERIKGIGSLRNELSRTSQSLHTLFLSVYLLGVSSSYFDSDLSDFGQEHLSAAEEIVRRMLADEECRRNHLTRFVVGVYVYWDMSCSFLASPREEFADPFSGDVYAFITTDMVGLQHPVTGPCIELFFVLAALGRYIRYTMAGGTRDHALELRLEEELLSWECADSEPSSTWQLTAEAFRKHGLIMFCRHCCSTSDEDALDTFPAIKHLTQQYAIDIVTSLSGIPVTSTHLALQPIPLVTAGAELTLAQGELRIETKARLLAIYSCSRIPSNLVAANLLDRIWQIAADGGSVGWLELLDQNNMKLRVG